MQFTSSINWITFQQDKRSTKAHLYSLGEGCTSNHIMHSPSLGSLAVPIRFVRYHSIQMFLDSSADILSMYRLNINGQQVKKYKNQSRLWSIFNTVRVWGLLFSPFVFLRMCVKTSKSPLERMILMEVSGREQFAFSEKNSHPGSTLSNKKSCHFYLETLLNSGWAFI